RAGALPVSPAHDTHFLSETNLSVGCPRKDGKKAVLKGIATPTNKARAPQEVKCAPSFFWEVRIGPPTARERARVRCWPGPAWAPSRGRRQTPTALRDRPCAREPLLSHFPEKCVACFSARIAWPIV